MSTSQEVLFHFLAMCHKVQDVVHSVFGVLEQSCAVCVCVCMLVCMCVCVCVCVRVCVRVWS